MAAAEYVRGAPHGFGKKYDIEGHYVAFTSPEGETRLNRSTAKAEFFPLVANFVTQQSQTMCSIASSVMVLNSLPVPKPFDAVYAPYRIFTQRTYFTAQVSDIVTYQDAVVGGMTLKQASEALRAHGVAATHHHANEFTVEEFRDHASSYLSHVQRYIIVNFERTVIGQQGHGHFSPIAAYDEDSDSFLILDVARYKYPPVWVGTTDLYDSMTTMDAAAKASRGYIAVTRQ